MDRYKFALMPLLCDCSGRCSSVGVVYRKKVGERELVLRRMKQTRITRGDTNGESRKEEMLLEAKDEIHNLATDTKRK